MEQFERLGVAKNVVKVLEEMGFNQPTPIQNKCIPVLFGSNTDLIAQAPTGTGKTAAFGIPLIEKIDVSEKAIQGLVLSPTRELAEQIQKQLFKFVKYKSPRVFCEVIYGGRDIDNQIKRLSRTTHILVATPGRLIDLMGQGVVDISRVKTLVLDEADEMLSLGFEKDIKKIFDSTKILRNRWLFSATLPHKVNAIIKEHLSENANRIVLSQEEKANKGLTFKYEVLLDNEKLVRLMSFLRDYKGKRGVVFCRTKDTANFITTQLKERKFKVDTINGDVIQKDRNKTMRQFRTGKLDFLVATDLAARGIDVEGLDFVLHYELPDTDEYFIHRSGRTARAGKKGLSICFVNSKEVQKLRGYEKRMKIVFE